MRFRPPDAIALVAVPLVVVALNAEGAILPTICLCLAGAAVVFAIAGHDELTWKRRVAIGALATVVDVAMLAYVYKVYLAKELKEQATPLLAATLPQPVSSKCPIPTGAVALYLGNTVSVITEFPHVVFRAGREDVFVIDRDSTGLLISFRVFNDRGNLVARLDRNAFRAANAASHVERPNSNHLIVFDDRDTQVLDVHFLNPKAVKITGILRYAGVDPIVISEKYLGVGGAIAPPACRTGAEVDFLF